MAFAVLLLKPNPKLNNSTITPTTTHRTGPNLNILHIVSGSLLQVLLQNNIIAFNEAGDNHPTVEPFKKYDSDHGIIWLEDCLLLR